MQLRSSGETLKDLMVMSGDVHLSCGPLSKFIIPLVCDHHGSAFTASLSWWTGLEKGTGLGYACYEVDLSTHASEAEYIPYATDCRDL